MFVYSLQHSHCFFYRLVIDEALVACLVLHLLDTSSHFSWTFVCSTAPQLRFSTFVSKTLRYWCCSDYVFFWESHSVSYKHGCLIPSTLSLMFFYRLVFNGAVVFRVVLLLVDTSLTFLRPPLCVALLHNWDFLPWLLRQRYWFLTDWVFFWEDHAFSYQHGCLSPSTLSLMFSLQVSVWRSCYLTGRFAFRSHIVAFFWGQHYV